MTARPDFRHDIQVLRGVAVLLVMLFHAYESRFQHGFLGVDVFFVISGFLVTSMIIRELDEGRFTLRSFYFRRIRRILPAALTTLLVTSLACYWVLTSLEWGEYLRQLLASTLFSENLILSRRGGYFAAKPQMEPLRHFWSLALEEQYYIVIPLLLIVLPAAWRLRAVALIAMASLLLCIAGATFAPVLTFYNLPTRAWELLAGALCGFAAVRARIVPPRWVCGLALLTIVAVSIIGFDNAHPRGDAMLVVGATCLILLSSDDWLPQSRLSAPVARIGNWSYSLYLIHWPILSLAWLAYDEAPSRAVRAGALVLSLLLAWIQYRLVELPFWRGWSIGEGRRWRQLALLATGLVLVPVPALMSAPKRQNPDAWTVFGLDQQPRKCVYSGPTVPPPFVCATGPAPAVALWGDSFARHLLGGILADAQLNQRVLIIVDPACPPNPGFAHVSAYNTMIRATACIRFNADAVAMLERSPIRVVVLSSPFESVLADDGHLILHEGRLARWSPSVVEGLVQAIARLQRAGKAVVIVGPPPKEGFDVGRCNLQVKERLLKFHRGDCGVHLANTERSNRQILEALPPLARATHSWLLMPSDVLCSHGSCRTEVGGESLYRDEGHLTLAGSKYVNDAVGLNALILRLIRDPGLKPSSAPSAPTSP